MAVLAAPSARAADTSSDSTNYIDLSAGGASVSGDTAAYQKRFDLNKNGYGGVDGFNFEKDLGRDTTLTANGHAIVGNQDYLLNFKITRDGVGFVDFGYKAFRTWYDGSGGYFPPSNLFFPPSNDNPYIDRTDLWLGFGITPESGPQFNFRYDYTTRKGITDSTSWGDTNLTAGLGTRNVIPSFETVDEHRNILDATLWQDGANTNWNLNAHYEADALNNALNVHRQPGASADRYLTQDNNAKPDIFNTHGSIDTKLAQNMIFTAGAGFFNINTAFGGSRIYGPEYDPVYDPLYANRQRYDEGFTNLSGSAQMQQSMANVSLMYTPTPTWTIVPSLLGEKVSWDANSAFTSTNVVGGPVTTDNQSSDSNQNLRDLTGSLEARYTGIKNFVFNAKGELVTSYGMLNQDLYEVATGVDTSFRTTNYRRNAQQLSLTANWYPQANLNYTAQYYYKGNQNGYITPRNSVVPGSGYPGLIAHEDFTTNDVNARVTWRALSQLRLVTRYDFQDSSIHSQEVGLAYIESSTMKTHIISETATWNPLMRWYVQASVNVVYDQLKTPASQLVGNAAGLVLNSDNNYINGSLSTGYAVDDKTDVVLNYTYYHATNYVDNSLRSTAFGQGGDDHYASITWSRRISPQLKYAITYAYSENHDNTSGGNTNYHANLIYTTMSYHF
jgi:hypothetical protein